MDLSVEVQVLFWALHMSLISKKDRDLTLEALQFYIDTKRHEFSEEKRAAVNALANWIRLENFKHEN